MSSLPPTDPPPAPPTAPPGDAPAKANRDKKEVLLAIGCGVVASVICVWMIFRPATAEPRVAQYFICIAVGLYLSLFFYILWPQPNIVIGVPNPWYTDQPVRVVGPIVLFGLSTGLLFHFMPAREQFGAVFEVDGNVHTISYSSDTSLELRGRRGEKLTYYLIPGDGLQSDTLKAVFVQFPPGEHQIEVVFNHHTYKPLQLTLRRSDVVLDLSRLEKRSP